MKIVTMDMSDTVVALGWDDAFRKLKSAAQDNTEIPGIKGVCHALARYQETSPEQELAVLIVVTILFATVTEATLATDANNVLQDTWVTHWARVASQRLFPIAMQKVHNKHCQTVDVSARMELLDSTVTGVWQNTSSCTRKAASSASAWESPGHVPVPPCTETPCKQPSMMAGQDFLSSPTTPIRKSLLPTCQH